MGKLSLLGVGGLSNIDTSLIVDLEPDSGFVLNGGNASQWTDKTSFGNNFTQSVVANQPIYNAAGMNGHPCLEFAGDSMGIAYNDSLLLAQSPFSISAWVEFNSLASYSPILSIGGSNDYGCFLWMPGGGWSWYDGSGVLALLNSVAINTWYHITAVRDVDNNLTIYFNDGSVASAARAFNFDVPGRGLMLGINASELGQTFKGNIGTLKIYKRGLSIEEIAEKYNADLAKYF